MCLVKQAARHLLRVEGIISALVNLTSTTSHRFQIRHAMALPAAIGLGPGTQLMPS